MNIKFKAWDKLTYEMYEVVSIDLYKTRNSEVSIITKNGDIIQRFWHEVSILQSTGLFDVNGKEIFEGDIVKAVSFARWIGVVEYSNEKTAFILRDIEKSPYRDDYVYLSQFEDGFESLGNIFQNKNLIEKELTDGKFTNAK